MKFPRKKVGGSLVIGIFTWFWFDPCWASKYTLLATNKSHQNSVLKMMFRTSPGGHMLVFWRVPYMGCILGVRIPIFSIQKIHPDLRSVAAPVWHRGCAHATHRWVLKKRKRKGMDGGSSFPWGWRLVMDDSCCKNPKQLFFNGCLVKQPFFYVKIWKHPIETTSYVGITLW